MLTAGTSLDGQFGQERAFAQWMPLLYGRLGERAPEPGSPETLRNEPDITEISLKRLQKIEAK